MTVSMRIARLCLRYCLTRECLQNARPRPAVVAAVDGGNVPRVSLRTPRSKMISMLYGRPRLSAITLRRIPGVPRRVKDQGA